MDKYVLGINAFHGDAAAALLWNGKIIAAAEEERFTRIKHNAGFPERAIHYCLHEAGIKIQDVARIAISRDPKVHFFMRAFFNLQKAFERCSPFFLFDRISHFSHLADLRSIIEPLFGKEFKGEIMHVEHHLAHMASAYYASGFDKAAILSFDAFGDFASTKWGFGEHGQVQILGEVTYPHSLGIVYTAITQFLGFPHYGDEYKVMGLAAFGHPVYEREFASLVHLLDDGQFKIDLKYFRHHSKGVEMTWESGAPHLENIYSNRLARLLGEPRNPNEPIEKRHENIAASLQLATEKVLLHILKHVHTITKANSLCLAGGVAFNSVANGKMISKAPFSKFYIQPAAGDAGTALGAAFYAAKKIDHALTFEPMGHAYWGSHYSNEEISNILSEEGISGRFVNDEKLIPWLSEEIAAGKIVGWFQGRMEFGPRALGNRSILVDPRRVEMKDQLNHRIKKRESFRPYAPAILERYAYDYFDIDGHLSPFMLLVCSVRSEMKEKIPAVTHVDGSARVQTVSEKCNPRFYALIEEFGNLTGVPVLLNTSFNENEPIVESPAQAIACFRRNEMDILVMENWVVEKG